MNIQEYIKREYASGLDTPAYYFDLDTFNDCVSNVKKKLNHIPLTYSIKVNHFLIGAENNELDYFEVCSPGELAICKELNISGDSIIYSGVNKEYSDIYDALSYGVHIATAESIKHIELEQRVAAELKIKQKVILRLTSGNQFGMSQSDIMDVLSNTSQYANLEFYGFHFYSGTQKNARKLTKDIEYLSAFLACVESELGFTPKLVEFGPGLAVDYFNEPYEESDRKTLDEASLMILEFSEKYPIGIELGRFLAASCGTFLTKVQDIKENTNTNYIICDGGIHHLKYYGQTMAMQVPKMESYPIYQTQKREYCICGSLCTVADVLIRQVELPEISIGDILMFYRCGAYSVTEGSLLFLSRDMPKIYVCSNRDGVEEARNSVHTYLLNIPNNGYFQKSN